MKVLEAILLGFVQGVTEFLPVSSSGHLVLVEKMLGFSEQGILFEVIVHLATSLAVLVYFRGTIMRISGSYLVLIALGSIPAGLIGLAFQSSIEGLFDSVKIVGIALTITGLLNFLTDRAQARRDRISKIDSVIIGVAQAVAIVPGISRSGATIFAGTFSGVSRAKAAEFSFLLSVPVIIGANALQLYKGEIDGSLGFSVYLAGFVSAFVFGFIAINVVMRMLSERRFRIFGIYAFILGIVAIILG